MATIKKTIVIDVNADAVEDLQRQFDGTTKEVKDTRRELKQLEQDIKNATDPQEVEQLTKEYKNLEKQLDDVADEYKKVDKEQEKATQTSEDFTNSQVETAENAFKVGEGLVGVFTLVSLASSESQEDTEALLAEVLQLVVVLDSVKKTAEGLRGAFKLAQGAAKNFGRGTKRALAATGIGLLVVAIGAVVVAFDSLSEEAEESGEDASDGISLITQAVDTLKAVFNTAKVVIIDNIKLVGLALSGLLAPLIILIRTIQNIKGAFDEGLTGLDAFKQGFQTTFEEGKALVDDLTGSVQNLGETFAEEQRKIDLERQIKQLTETIKLTNGLNASNASLLKAQAQATDNLNERIALERQSIQLRLDAINQELSLFPRILELRQLSTDEEIRQNDLLNQRKLLALESAELSKQALEEIKNAQETAFNDEIAKLEDIAETRKQVLNATVQDATQLNREILDVELETQAQRLELIKDFYGSASNEAIRAQAQLEILQQEGTQAFIDQLNEQAEAEEQLALQRRERIKKDNEFALAQVDERAKLELIRLKELRNDEIITQEEFNERSTMLEEERLLEQIRLREQFGQSTLDLQSQLLDLQQKREDENQAKQAEQRTAQIEQFKEFAQTIADIAFLAQEAQINRLDQLIGESQSRIDALNNTLQATQDDRAQIESDIAETQDKQREANATLDKELREQLNAQRQERARLIQLEKQQAQQAKEAEEEQIRLENEKAEREKRLAKQQANLALALALVESAPALVKSLSLPFPASLASFATITALITKSIASARQASQSFADGGMLKGPSHADGGIRGTGRFNNIEVEGGEFVVNKRDTARNLSLLTAINSGKKVMQNGGVLTPSQGAVDASAGGQDVAQLAESVKALAKRPMVVGVTDIADGLNRVGTIDNASQL